MAVITNEVGLREAQKGHSILRLNVIGGVDICRCRTFICPSASQYNGVVSGFL
jgi:hypothetical protein